ncbi:MAG: branched-chain amino acid aminotransferase [Caulobacteraceae bacterium]
MASQPFDDRDGWIWMDGEFKPWREANVHVLNHGLHYASSVFEGERMYDGEIFKLNEHNERLINSGRVLGFEIPYSVAELNEACKETCRRNNLTEAYVRPVAWRGSDQMSISAPNSSIHVAVAAWPWPSLFDPEIKKQGIRMTRARYKRPSAETAPTNAKSAGGYMICTISKHESEAKGFDDALMLDYRGYVAEATGANIFFVRDGEIHTPIADCFLNGITRQTVMGLARDLGFIVNERRIEEGELGSFTECFLTGTAAEVTPVRQIDEHTYTPGNITLTLFDDYQNLVRRKARVEA